MILRNIEKRERRDGKEPWGSNIVINTDELLIDEIVEVMKKHGHCD